MNLTEILNFLNGRASPCTWANKAAAFTSGSLAVEGKIFSPTPLKNDINPIVLLYLVLLFELLQIYSFRLEKKDWSL